MTTGDPSNRPIDNDSSIRIQLEPLRTGEVALIEQTLAQIAPRGEALVERFFERLFSRHPRSRQLFGAAPPERQRRQLWNALKAAINELRRQAATHDARRPESEVRPVADTFSKLLADTAGPLWTPPVRSAWQRVSMRLWQQILGAFAPEMESLEVQTTHGLWNEVQASIDAVSETLTVSQGHVAPREAETPLPVIADIGTVQPLHTVITEIESISRRVFDLVDEIDELSAPAGRVGPYKALDLSSAPVASRQATTDLHALIEQGITGVDTESNRLGELDHPTLEGILGCIESVTTWVGQIADASRRQSDAVEALRQSAGGSVPGGRVNRERLTRATASLDEMIRRFNALRAPLRAARQPICP